MPDELQRRLYNLTKLTINVQAITEPTYTLGCPDPDSYGIYTS